LRGGQPLGQPMLAELGDGGNEDQQLGKHDENDRQDEELGRKAERR
jgi:hypothetical protein